MLVTLSASVYVSLATIVASLPTSIFLSNGSYSILKPLHSVVSSTFVEIHCQSFTRIILYFLPLSNPDSIFSSNSYFCKSWSSG